MVSSVWFKFFLYSLTKCGPPSLLLTKGTRLHILPKIFKYIFFRIMRSFLSQHGPMILVQLQCPMPYLFSMMLFVIQLFLFRLEFHFHR
ncbi:UNVERIFIED_CONTAM: fam91a1 [Trichonephila clavipes]